MGAIDTEPRTSDNALGTPKIAPFLVDCDLHHLWHKIDDIFPYLPRQYVQEIKDFGSMFPGGMWTNMPNNNGYRADHDVDEQTNFAEFTVTEHLDRYDFDAGILTGNDVYQITATTNLDYAAALCRAYNDWTLEHWIATDERFRMILSVGPNDPIQAVQEIDRLGGHPAVVGVMMPAGGRYPYGNRMYHPIYEAAERHGLVMVTHFGGEGVGANNAPTAAGYPTYYLEMRMARPQIAQAHVTSLICEGVFEKYTDLKWVFVEVDSWWIPGLLDHFDADWKALRDYTPWVKQLPSEYFRKHIRVGTQPLEQPARREDLHRFFEQAHAREVLVYASDFPHWDWDEPVATAATFPKSIRAEIFGSNARQVFNL